MRRFVYLVVGGCYRRRTVMDGETFRMHRIDMSRFFYPPHSPPPPPNNAMVVDGRLPRPSMTFRAPSSEHHDGTMHFMLLDGRDKVLTTDQTGRAAIYDARARAMRTAPTLAEPKTNFPVSVAVGGHNLYVLDTTTRPKEHSFEALVYERGLHHPWLGKYYDDWRCHPLPPPPFLRHAVFVAAYTVVGGSHIWMSTKGDDGCTYSFDTDRRAWAKQGDWTLPFCGHAEYVPEYNLWFGLSDSTNNNNNTNHLCALDLAGAAKPVLCNLWEEDLKPPKDWRSTTSYLVHLGSARFCVARFFYKLDKIPGYGVLRMDTDPTVHAVFTGVEVGKTGRGLRMIKHKSECYSFDELISEWVL